MNFRSILFSFSVFGSLTIILVIAVLSIAGQSKGHAGSGVILAEDASVYTLSNKSVIAKVNKQSGDLVSLKYKGRELLEARFKRLACSGGFLPELLFGFGRELEGERHGRPRVCG